MKIYPLDITFFCSGMPMAGNAIASGKSLGGSETCAVQMAETLARKGHRPIIFCNTEKIHAADGVTYVPIGWVQQPNGGAFPKGFLDYARSTPHDLLVVMRMPGVLSWEFKSKVNLLWQHDLATKTGPSNFHATCWNMDRILVISEFMKRQYKEVHGGPDDLYHVTRNGIDLNLIDSVPAQERDRYKIMFTSRPERGLDIMLREVFPRILAKEPKAQLHISRYDDVATLPLYEECARMAAQFGDRVMNLGNLGKQELYKHYKQARVFAYSSVFEEVSPLRGDALIDTPAGRFPIEQLWHENKTDFWVWSWNHKQRRMILAKARRVIKTRQNAKMITMRFRWEKGRKARQEGSLTCTPDHEIMLRDGSYVRADKLKIGNKLMPFGRTPGFGRFKFKDGRLSRYWYVSKRNLSDRVSEHRYITELVLGRPLISTEIVDHINGDTDNNDPTNLRLYASHSEHRRNHWKELNPNDRIKAAAERADILRRFHASLTPEQMYKIKSEAGRIGGKARHGLRPENHIVIGVEQAASADAYCMEVDETHNFVANGIVVHNCLTAVEFAACGGVFVGPWKAALPETVGDTGILIRDDGSVGRPGDPLDPGFGPVSAKFCDRMADEVVDLIRNDDRFERLAKAGRKRAEDRTWDAVADDWVKLTHELIEQRSDEPKRVLKHFLVNSDVVAAIKYATAKDDEKLAKSIQKYIDRFVPFMNAPESERKQEMAKFYEERSGGDGANWQTAFWADREPRLRILLDWIAQHQEEVKSVLDFGCAHGGYARALSNALPSLRVLGVDVAPSLIRCANELKAAKMSDGNPACLYPENLSFYVADEDTNIRCWNDNMYGVGEITNEETGKPLTSVLEKSAEFDLVVSMEVLEHLPNAEEVAKKLERHCKPGGWMCFTIPHGHRERDEFLSKGVLPVHVRSFDRHDLQDLFGRRDGFQVIAFSDFLELEFDRTFAGWFMVFYKNDGKEMGQIDWERKFFLQGPRETVSVCMITNNAEATLHRTLKSVQKLADQIIVVDNGPSVDSTRAIAKTYTDDVRDGTSPFWCYAHKGRHHPMEIAPGVCDMAGFETPRNESVMGAWGDWICFVPGTQIRTRNGYQAIENVKVGDEVLTHNGRFRKVNQLHKNDYDGEIVRLKPSYLAESVGMTPNHPVLSVKNFECYIHGKFCFPECRRQWRYYQPETRRIETAPFDESYAVANCRQGYQYYETAWREASDINQRDTVVSQGQLPETIENKPVDIVAYIDSADMVIDGDYVRPDNGKGIRVPRWIDADGDFWRLCGYYLAEGHCSENNWTVGFSFHVREVGYHEDVVGLMSRFFGLVEREIFRPDSNAMQIVFNSKVATMFFANFLGKGADNKRLPECAMNLPGEMAFQIFQGVWRGDGTLHADSFKVTSNSRMMLIQLRDILMRFGIASGMNRHDRMRNHAYVLTIGGAGLDILNRLCGMMHPFRADRNNEKGWKQDGWTDGEKLYLAVRDVWREQYRGPVYNLGVEEDNSYQAEDIVVHNCWIDADEQLLNWQQVWQYLRPNSYLGYAINQHHLSVDPPGSLRKDIPVRLFRNHRGMRFYGCMTPRTKVVTNPGLEEIKDIQVGTLVRTHDGTYRPVTKLWKYEVKDEMLRVLARGMPEPLELTRDHKVYAIKHEQCFYNYGKHYLCKPTCEKSCPHRFYEHYSPDWIMAKDLKVGDILMYPTEKVTIDVDHIKLSNHAVSGRLTGKGSARSWKLAIGKWSRDIRSRIAVVNDKIELSEGFLRLCGYYVSDGCIAEGAKLIISFGEHEQSHADDVSETAKALGFNYSEIHKRHMITTKVYGRPLCEWLKGEFGSGARIKKAPLWLMRLPVDKQKEFLRGLWRGDGNVSGTLLRYATSSVVLAHQVQDLLLRQKIMANIRYGKASKTYEVFARLQATKFLDWAMPAIGRMRTRQTWTDGDYVYMPIRDIERFQYEGPIFDLTIEGNHSFVANRAAVSNCVHEHAELAINGGVGSHVVSLPVDIHHDGYLTEPIRRGRFQRNIRLLECDRIKYPDRLLGIYLYDVRDNIHMARYEMERNGGRLTEQGVEHCRRAIAAFRQHFLGKDIMLAQDGMGYYSDALNMLGLGIEIALDIDVRPQGAHLNGSMQRFRVMDREEAKVVTEQILRQKFGPFEGRYIA